MELEDCIAFRDTSRGRETEFVENPLTCFERKLSRANMDIQLQSDEEEMELRAYQERIAQMFSELPEKFPQDLLSAAEDELAHRFHEDWKEEYIRKLIKEGKPATTPREKPAIRRDDKTYSLSLIEEIKRNPDAKGSDEKLDNLIRQYPDGTKKVRAENGTEITMIIWDTQGVYADKTPGLPQVNIATLTQAELPKFPAELNTKPAHNLLHNFALLKKTLESGIIRFVDATEINNFVRSQDGSAAGAIRRKLESAPGTVERTYWERMEARLQQWLRTHRGRQG